jgi:putative copper resistance protein D
VVPLALVLLRALGLVGQGLVLGGAAFGLVALRPGPGGDPDLAPAARRCLGLACGGAALLLAAQAAALGLIVASVADAPGAAPLAVLATPFALAGGVGMLAAVAALAAGRRARRAQAWTAAPLLAGMAAAVGAAGTSHAAGRLEDRGWLLVADAIHQMAIAVWAGGLVHLTALVLLRGDRALPTRILRGFSRLAQGAVLVLALSGGALALAYVGDLAALVGTAYGGMLLAKLSLFAGLLALGALNFRAVRRLPPDRAVLPPRLRRFVEVEAGLAITLLFTAASLGSAPPGVDVRADRATGREIVERFTPRWPSFSTPSLAELAVAAAVDDPLAPRTPADSAWSEYNHNVAGLFVLLIGLLAALHRLGGIGWARHWPLVFLGLSAFLLFRSDPNAWPLSATQTFLGSLTDPEIVQHRVLALLPAALGLIEWLIQERRLAAPGWARAIPLLIAVGGGLVLAHAHPLIRMKEAYLMEVTHLPLGLLAG